MKWFGWLAIALVGLMVATAIKWGTPLLLLIAFGGALFVAATWRDATPLVAVTALALLWFASKRETRNGS